ncbi:NF-kappa-B inhibitor epsilon-like [Gigantopelta aegis]|uniref:NF-kappa-B inhibitor epsilon-like n=1 Tax=Gigantopelta aegis TaxID=1735272 RepID=UPI001B88C1B9|nr:NF-kappa-B inhibitor epsilon-like [Gigantopelta aegis]
MKTRKGNYLTAKTLKRFGSFAISKGDATVAMKMEDYFSRMQISSDCVSSNVSDVFSQDGDGDTYLHLAVIQGDERLCYYFIATASCVDLLNLQNHQFQTPLHLAVATRQLEVVRRLLEAGASRDCRDSLGNTPLHVACREGHADVVASLLSDGNNGKGVAHSKDVALKNYDGHTCLHMAAMTTNFTNLDLLLEKGADINAGDMKSGRTILHYAAELGSVTLTNYLMQQKNLDINRVTYGGKTALSLAAGRGFHGIVTVLLSHGADPSQLYVQDSESDESDMEM